MAHEQVKTQVLNQLLEDPEFLDLTDSEQDSIFDEALQKRNNIVPGTQSFLQRGIQSANQFVNNDLPAAGLNIVDTFSFGQAKPALGRMERGMARAGFSSEESLIPEAKTGLGKAVAGFSSVFPAVVGAKALGRGAFGLAKKATAGIRSGPTKEVIKGLRTEGESLSFRGAEGVKESVKGVIKKGGEDFGETFKKLTSKMKRSDFVKTLDDSIDDLASETAEISGTDASALNEIKKALLKGKKGSEVLTKEFVQAQASNTFDQLTSRGKAIFTKHHLDKLDQTIPGLRQAKSKIAPNFTLAKESKAINKTALKKISSGRASKEEISKLEGIEKGAGTSFVNQAGKLGVKTVEARNKLEKIIGRQRALKTTGFVAGGGFGIREILRAIKGAGGGQ